jgi:hypothetical protein
MHSLLIPHRFTVTHQLPPDSLFSDSPSKSLPLTPCCHSLLSLFRLSLGDPLAALPVLHFALLKYSRHVAAFILQKGVQVGSSNPWIPLLSSMFLQPAAAGT